MPRYDGPRELAQSLTGFARPAPRTPPGIAKGCVRIRSIATSASPRHRRRIGVKHIRAIKPFAQPTGWHWHDMTAHYVYVLRGSLTFRFAGVDGDVTLHAGDGLSQPPACRTT
jgi:quercetin dioxygenase-like cupin family protein